MKIKILATVLLMAFCFYSKAVVTETDEFIYTNNVTFYKISAITTNAMVFDNQASSNFQLSVVSSAIGLQYGRIYVSDTNVFSETCVLTWYDSNDYLCSNAYWRASVSFVNTALASNMPLTNIVYVVDASGFGTNNLLWFGSSNQFHRISGITGNVVNLECPLIKGEASNAIVAKVVEFGGFSMVDERGSNTIYGSLTATNAFSATFRGIYKYKR